MGVCCVPGCSTPLTSAGHSFYSIPKKPEWRRRAFLKAINRVNFDGSEWVPTPNSKVCSNHFTGGHKSENAGSTNYLPTECMPKQPSTYWNREPGRFKRNTATEERVCSYIQSSPPAPQHTDDTSQHSPCDEPSTHLTQPGAPLNTSSPTGPTDQDPGISLHCDSTPCNLGDKSHSVPDVPSGQSDATHPGVKEETHDRKDLISIPLTVYEGLLQHVEEQQKLIETLSLKVTSLEEKVLSIDNIKMNEKLVRFYTGFSNYETFSSLFSFLLPKAERMRSVEGKMSDTSRKIFNRTRKLSLEDEFFMTIVRLKVGMLEVNLARNFGICQSYCSKIINTWIDLLYWELKSITLFSSKQKVLSTLPNCFQKFSGTRVILDCTEQFIETPSSVNAKKSTYSSYKSNNTMKFLIGITPHGYMSFISRAWGGRASDKLITRDSGIYHQLDEGDQVMVDRGFDIQAELKEFWAELVIPAFKGLKEQLSASEVHRSMRISQSRIHVERFIGRVKEFHVLNREMRLSMHSRVEQIFCVCGYLTTFQSPIIKT